MIVFRERSIAAAFFVGVAVCLISWNLYAANTSRQILSSRNMSIVRAKLDTVRNLTLLAAKEKDTKVRDSAMKTIADEYSKLINMFAYLKVPARWCGADDMDSLPRSPKQILELLDSLDTCVKMLEEESKILAEEHVFQKVQDPNVALRFFKMKAYVLRQHQQREEPDSFDLYSIIEWIRNLLGIEFSKGGAEDSGSGLLSRTAMAISILVLVVLGLLIALHIRRLILRRMKESKHPTRRTISAQVLHEQLVSSQEWSKADELFEQGEYRLALRMYFFAWLNMLEQLFGVDKPFEDETNREWLKRVYQSMPESVRTDTIDIVRNFDRHWYGLREPDSRRIERFRALLIEFAGKDKQL